MRLARWSASTRRARRRDDGITPGRNRILSGLSLAALVVEAPGAAAVRSSRGTALEQGRGRVRCPRTD